MTFNAQKITTIIYILRSHGRRPITLIGFSLGARVIYHCLMEMNKRKPDSLGNCKLILGN